MSLWVFSGTLPCNCSAKSYYYTIVCNGLSFGVYSVLVPLSFVSFSLAACLSQTQFRPYVKFLNMASQI